MTIKLFPNRESNIPLPRVSKRAGVYWTPLEDHILLKAFDMGFSARRMARGHGRTIGGINSRVRKLMDGDPLNYFVSPHSDKIHLMLKELDS
jgi:hypothetical protein